MLILGTRTVEEQILLECVCDRCGKSITPDDLIEWQEKHLIRFAGGYGSVFGDGKHIECDLCQSCLQELIGLSVPLTAENKSVPFLRHPVSNDDTAWRPCHRWYVWQVLPRMSRHGTVLAEKKGGATLCKP